jgi:predicted membrane protein
MEKTDLNDEASWRKYEKAHRRGKIVAGLMVLTAGILFLARETGTQLPDWLFSWKTLLIAIGIAHGVRHNFRRPGAYIMILIGSAFLLTEYYPLLNLRAFLLPVLLILIGLFIIFRPVRRRHYGYCRGRWQQHYGRASYSEQTSTGGPERSAGSSEDYLDSTAVFGGVRKNILSKNFKGGEIVNVFGGTELNLSQADFNDGIELEITSVFGGTKLIVPANWEIKSDIVAILGGIDDKRAVQSATGSSPAKVLRLTGTVFIGGIEIRSF